MPVRVPPRWLDCSFYVYRSVSDATAGVKSGGCGCLVGVPSVHENWLHLYAVTNRHVVDKNYGVLRLNTHDGRMSTIETQWAQWETLEASGDVAVMPLDLGAQFRWKAIMIAEFMPPQTLEEFNIWPGDEVFMIGRLINQSGRQRNTPVVRSGTLAMLPDPSEPVGMGEYGDHEAFLVECRSVSGFSGSPVFLTTTQVISGTMPKTVKYACRNNTISAEIPQPPLSSESGPKTTILTMQGNWGPWFIGVDRGHIPLFRPVYSLDEQTRRIDQETETGYRVEHNTGIACVIPSWRIVDVLNKEALMKQRKKDDDEIACKKSAGTTADLSGEDKPVTQSDS